MNKFLLLSVWILIGVGIADIAADASAATCPVCPVCKTFEQLHKDHDDQIRADRAAVGDKRREAVKLWWEDITNFPNP